MRTTCATKGTGLWKSFSALEKQVPAKEAARMWTVVYLAKNKKVADRISELMSREGVLVKLQPVSKNTGDEDSYFEILVLESEVEEAHNILYESGY